MGYHSEHKKFEQVGYVDVDAGLIWVGDPCYIITDTGERRAEDLGENWSEFCDKVTLREKDGVSKFGHRAGGSGMGIAISTLWGDGSYPVYVEQDKQGGVRRVLIDFDPEYFDREGD